MEGLLSKNISLVLLGSVLTLGASVAYRATFSPLPNLFPVSTLTEAGILGKPQPLKVEAHSVKVAVPNEPAVAEKPIAVKPIQQEKLQVPRLVVAEKPIAVKPIQQEKLQPQVQAPIRGQLGRVESSPIRILNAYRHRTFWSENSLNMVNGFTVVIKSSETLSPSKVLRATWSTSARSGSISLGRGISQGQIRVFTIPKEAFSDAGEAMNLKVQVEEGPGIGAPQSTILDEATIRIRNLDELLRKTYFIGISANPRADYTPGWITNWSEVTQANARQVVKTHRGMTKSSLVQKLRQTGDFTVWVNEEGKLYE